MAAWKRNYLRNANQLTISRLSDFPYRHVA
jgi:hypothetical protein